MNTVGRIQTGLVFLAMTAAGTLRGQTVPAASQPAATAPSTNPAGRKVTVEELLPKNASTFEFSEKSMVSVLEQLGKTYGVTVINNNPEASALDNLITLKPAGPLKARQAISLVNDTLIALGYTLVESVKGDPPVAVLTVVPTKRDESAVISVYHESDPEKIPEGEELRTQVINLKNLDPAKAKETVVSVLGKRASVTINDSTKTIIITDTASHVHSAAALIQVLEKQAAEAK